MQPERVQEKRMFANAKCLHCRTNGGLGKKASRSVERPLAVQAASENEERVYPWFLDKSSTISTG
jgi:hypothetical protein